MNTTSTKPIVVLSGEAARKIFNRPQKLDKQAEAVKKARKELKKAGYRF